MRFKTLIIDDDPIATMLLNKKLDLNGDGDIPLLFENGQQGIDYITSQPPNQNYLIFLDIHMPILDGWQFLQGLQSQNSTNNYFIYVTSSSVNPVEIQQADKFPEVVNFLSKPITHEQITQCKNLINRLKSA